MMRCKATTGFLMLRRCESEAMFKCLYCGAELCGEHSTVVYDSAQPPPAEAVPQKPPMGGQTVACPACTRKQQQPSAATGVVGDSYYHYPYYGSYQPFYFGTHFSDRDRRVFERQNQPVSDVTESDVGESDALGS
jgi:hypothetical protein